MTIRLSAMFEELMKGLMKRWKMQQQLGTIVNNNRSSRSRRHINVRNTTTRSLTLRSSTPGDIAGPSTSTSSSLRLRHAVPGPSTSHMDWSSNHSRMIDDESDSPYENPNSKPIGKNIHR